MTHLFVAESIIKQHTKTFAEIPVRREEKGSMGGRGGLSGCWHTADGMVHNIVITGIAATANQV